MAELNLKQIIDRLNAEFTGDTRKLVFWYDDKAEFAEDIESVVKRDNYTNAEPRPKSKYIFREAVLVNAGDILLVLGLFCTFGALIAPIIIDFGVEAPMIWATCGAVVIFAITMITWATLRTLAEISRMLRNGNK